MTLSIVRGEISILLANSSILILGLALIIPKDMGQKTIIINSVGYKTNENFLKEKLQGLSHEYLNKFKILFTFVAPN